MHKFKGKDDKMKQLNLKKIVDLDKTYDELHSLDIKCMSDHQEEYNGIQVNGLLMIEGFASIDHIKKNFKEEVILDLFVSKEKLDGTPFQLQLKTYHGQLQEEQLELELLFEIQGMSDEKVVQHEENAFSDLFENDDDTYVCSVMAVVKKDDTYASIAHAYQVSEAALREYNHNMVLEEKMLIRIPLEKMK